MNLAEHLVKLRSSNQLTDGVSRLSWRDLQPHFSRLEQCWSKRNPESHPGTCVLASRNDLASAVAVLWFLATNRSCYFWRPPSTPTVAAFPWATLPAYCQTAVLPRTTIGDREGEPQIDFDLVLRPVHHAQVADRTPTPVQRESAWFSLATSGTTEQPKLAVYTAERLLGNAANCVERLQLTAADRVLIPLPLAHLYGLGAALLPAVLAGASVCLLPQVNLLTYLQAEQQFDPTVVFLTPTFARQLVAVRKQPRHYRLSVLGADRMDAESFARYEAQHGCTVCIYGSTELGAVAASSPADPFAQRQQTSGRLLNQVRLLPRSDHSAIGPLCFQHPFGMVGYADATGEPVLPPETPHQDVYSTQDLGHLDAQGMLRIAGRLDDCLKRDGHLVAPGYVEQMFEQQPEIARAIVLGGKAGPRGPELIAICLRQPGGIVDETELLRRCRSACPAHAWPDHIHFLDQIPLTETGKPDRRALRSMYNLD